MHASHTPLHVRAAAIGYAVARNCRDNFGRLHRYRMGPTEAGGTTTYHPSLDSVVERIAWVETLRSWESPAIARATGAAS